MKKSWREVRQFDMEEIAYWVAYDRIYPMDDGWITSAKLIMTVCGMMGVKTSAGEIYPHLEDPRANDPNLIYAKFRVWGAFQNTQVEKAEALKKARAGS